MVGVARPIGRREKHEVGREPDKWVEPEKRGGSSLAIRSRDAGTPTYLVCRVSSFYFRSLVAGPKGCGKRLLRFPQAARALLLFSPGLSCNLLLYG